MAQTVGYGVGKDLRLADAIHSAVRLIGIATVAMDGQRSPGTGYRRSAAGDRYRIGVGHRGGGDARHLNIYPGVRHIAVAIALQDVPRQAVGVIALRVGDRPVDKGAQVQVQQRAQQPAGFR